MALVRRPGPAVLFATCFLAIAFSGCFASAPGFVGDWADELAAHGAVGVPATFAATATDQHIEGEGTLAAVAAPFVLVAAPRFANEVSIVYFLGTVPGVGTGIVGIQGDEIIPATGSLTGASVAKVSVGERIAIRLKDTFGYHGPVFEWPSWAFNESSAWVGGDATPIDPSTFHFTNAERAFLAHENTSRITNLTFPVTVQAEGMKWHRDSYLGAASATIRFDRFGWAGDATDLRLSPKGRATVTDAAGVFGNDATLQVAPGQVASVGDFRLTQAITPDGLLLDADVEVRLDDDTPEVTTGEPGWIIARYRERSYTGSAVLADIDVSGSGAAYVTVPVDSPPWIVEEIWASVADSGWAGGFAAIPLVIVSPFILVAEAFFTFFDCVFADCPDQHPYPVWIEAGEIGRFYFAFDGREAPPGEYDVKIAFTGQNHDPVVVEARVTVE